MSAHVYQPTNQQSYHSDQNRMQTDQSCCHSLQTDQSNQHSGNSQLLPDIRNRHIDQHSQVTSHTDQTNSVIHNNHHQTLSDHPVHNTSEPVTLSHKQEGTVYTLQHTGSVSEHSTSSIDYSSDDESVSSSTGSSIHSEVHPTLSTTQQPLHNTDTHTSITHHLTSSNSSSLSVSDNEELLVEADGPVHSEAIPLSAPVHSQDEQTTAMMQSITSNLTTVTPTELSCDSEHSEHHSESESVEVVVSSTESSEQVEESSTATLVISQPLLDHDVERKEQQQSVVNGLRDITNSLSPSPSMTLQQDDHVIPSPPHSTLHQSPPKR